MSSLISRIHKKALFSLVILTSLWSFSIFGLDDLAIIQSRNQNPLQHEVSVTLKLIQVYVTDKAGNPVLDLEKDDFEIYDQRERKPITEFERHLLTLPEVIKKPVVKTAIPEQTQKPPEKLVETREKSESVPPSSKMNRKFILFFDFAFNNTKGILKSKEAALHFMDTKLLPEDEVAVLSYSVIHGLIIHEFFTTRHKKVREVIKGFGTKEIAGRAYNVELIYWTKIEPGEYPLADYSKDFSLGENRIGLDRRIYKEQASRFSLNMEALSKALRYIPGYKHIIFFSSGIAGSVMYGKPSSIQRMRYSSPGSGMGESVIRSRYERMLNELSSSNSIVHAISTEGFDPLSHRDADLQGARALMRLSRKTGGNYYGNATNYEDIMEELQSLTGSYYVLGYYVSEKWDGQYHKLDVKVKKKGYKVHAQRGYYNQKPFTKYSKLEKQLHLVDMALTERPLFQDPVRFPLEVEFSTDDEKDNLTLHFNLPERDISAISGKEVEIVSLVFDEKDDVVGMKREEMDFSKHPSWDFLHTSKLSVPPGRYKCRVVIRNPETGRAAVGACEVAIHEHDTKSSIDPPRINGLRH